MNSFMGNLLQNLTSSGSIDVVIVDDNARLENPMKNEDSCFILKEEEQLSFRRNRDRWSRLVPPPLSTSDSSLPIPQRQTSLFDNQCHPPNHLVHDEEERAELWSLSDLDELQQQSYTPPEGEAVTNEECSSSCRKQRRWSSDGIAARKERRNQKRYRPAQKVIEVDIQADCSLPTIPTRFHSPNLILIKGHNEEQRRRRLSELYETTQKALAGPVVARGRTTLLPSSA